jgi:hypothetical protein
MYLYSKANVILIQWTFLLSVEICRREGELPVRKFRGRYGSWVNGFVSVTSANLTFIEVPYINQYEKWES